MSNHNIVLYDIYGHTRSGEPPSISSLFVYLWSGRLYDAINGHLLKDENGNIVDPQYYSSILNRSIPLLTINDRILPLITSKIGVVTLGDKWSIIVETPERKIRQLSSSGDFDYSEDQRDGDMIEVIVPDLQALRGLEGAVESLPILPLSDIDDRKVLSLVERHTLNLLERNTWEIPFDEIQALLNSGQLARFDFLPEHQRSNVRPGNFIASFYSKDGLTTYLVELRYDQSTNQIFPPS